MAKVGRKTKYTKARVDLILEALEAGMSIAGACQVVSIYPSTFYTWQKEHVRFSEQVLEAQAGAERKAIDLVLSNPQTALKWLQMQRKDDYRPPQQDLRVEEIKGIILVEDGTGWKELPPVKGDKEPVSRDKPELLN